MFVRHWGDLPLVPDTDSGIAAIEREQITKPRPVEVEAPKLYQPCPKVKCETPRTVSDAIQDPFTMHTIQLMQHAKKLKMCLRTLSQHPDASVNIPPIPEFPLMHKHDADAGSETKLKKKFCPPPDIGPVIAHKILKKAVGTICAHIGYETTTDSVLEFLTSVVHTYLLKIMQLLRRTVDKEAMVGYTGFVDVMERTFQDAGIGSIVTLQEFYQDRIVRYHGYMLAKAHALMDSCNQVQQPAAKCKEEFRAVKLSDSELCEIKFPVFQEVDDVYQEPTQIHLQLEELQSTVQNMECDTSASLKDEMSGRSSPMQTDQKDVPSTVTPSLDPDEEICVSDSPTSAGVSSQSDV